MPHDPERIDLPVLVRGGGGKREWLARPLGNIKARAAPRLDDTFRDQPVIGFHHSRFRDVHRFRKAADRGQPRPGCEAHRGDAAANDAHDLFDEWHPVGGGALFATPDFPACIGGFDSFQAMQQAGRNHLYHHSYQYSLPELSGNCL
ncbi:hypothetical protein BF16_09220 [Brucella suis 1330]|nr:hypothetical protein BF16_09220 [Brucella suis 1330]